MIAVFSMVVLTLMYKQHQIIFEKFEHFHEAPNRFKIYGPFTCFTVDFKFETP